MKYTTIKSNVAEIHAEYKKKESIPGSLSLELKQTGSYERFLASAKKGYKELQGSEKQIAWAMKIREKLAEKYATQLCQYFYFKNAFEQGIEPAFFYDKLDKNKACNTFLGLLDTSSASLLIDSRDVSLFTILKK